ncbi:MAG: hypothetical protein HC820_04895 [Hydrococcus sp. RM1_1_31]|nr:hypothetical protein [Hydrococcus sp. RM1_1_31]
MLIHNCPFNTLSYRLNSNQFKKKRQSLQVVINLFSETNKAFVAAPTEEETSTPQTQTEKQPELVDESQTVVELEPQESLTASTPITVKKKATSTKKKSQTKKTQPSKATKQAPGWQYYLREEFRNSSLPQAIVQVLHSDAKRVWDTATVADAIFVEAIPQEVKKKVRLQITNLLAQGARENKWHREQQGSYTLSKQAAKSQSR